MTKNTKCLYLNVSMKLSLAFDVKAVQKKIRSPEGVCEGIYAVDLLKNARNSKREEFF